MADQHEDDVPSHRLKLLPDPEATLSTLPPAAEPGTEASALGIPPDPATPRFRDPEAEERIAIAVAAALEPRFVAMTNAIVGMREAVREEVRATTLMLDEQHRGDMAEADRKWDERVTRLEGHQEALVTVVGNGLTAITHELEKLSRLVGSVLTHVTQGGGKSGGHKIDDAEESSDTADPLAVTRSG